MKRLRTPSGVAPLATTAAFAVLMLTAASAQAQRTQVGPDSQALRPTTAEQQQRMLDELVRRNRAMRLSLRSGPPQVLRMPDGSQAVAHDASTINFTVVRRTADGTLQTACMPAGEALQRFATDVSSEEKQHAH